MIARPRTLIVDDTPLNLKLLSALLAAKGFPVTTATSAEAASALLAAEPGAFGLLLLDVRLPGIDGLTFARQLRADPLHAGIVIVAVTANAMKADETAALDAGCDGFVTKPVNTRTLVSTLDEILGRVN